MTQTRKNVAHISDAERKALRDAILTINRKLYPDGVSEWFKQDQIHQATHVHGGASFLTWHRDLLNRFEKLLQSVDPSVALHYWDWTTDPRASSNGAGGVVNLFTSDFMGNSQGTVGAPFQGILDNNGVLEGSRNQTNNPADPPQQITRGVSPGVPGVQQDAQIVNVANNSGKEDQWKVFRLALENSPNHNSMHGWLGGTIRGSHTAFEDPFVFIMHANIDRLWALWQTAPGYGWRMDPNQMYGKEATNSRITENLQPWAGGTGTRPWAAPENQQVAINSLNPLIVTPPGYDTNYKTLSLVGGSGTDFHDFPKVGQHLSKMVIRSGDVIDAIQVSYDGVAMPQHGGNGGVAHNIDFASDEYIIEASGIHGNYFGANHILELTIKTNKRTLPTYGTTNYSSGQKAFSLKGKIVAFYGKRFVHSDGTDYVSALGAIVQ